MTTSADPYTVARKRLLAVRRTATPSEVSEGRGWYPAAWECAKRVAGQGPLHFGPVRAAGVLAALSPGTRWENAERMALTAARSGWSSRRSVDHAVRGAYPIQRLKAIRLILDGAHPLDVLHGPKEVAFFKAITGDRLAVPLDRWAIRAAGIDKDTINTGERRTLDAAYTEAAFQMGDDPRDFQAIVWVIVRDRKDTDEAAI